MLIERSQNYFKLESKSFTKKYELIEDNTLKKQSKKLQKCLKKFERCAKKKTNCIKSASR